MLWGSKRDTWACWLLEVLEVLEATAERNMENILHLKVDICVCGLIPCQNIDGNNSEEQQHHLISAPPEWNQHEEPHQQQTK